jgi:ABC-type microcin C transport system permease subunit YejB
VGYGRFRGGSSNITTVGKVGKNSAMKKLRKFLKSNSILVAIWLILSVPLIFFRGAPDINENSVFSQALNIINYIIPLFSSLSLIMIVWGIGAYLYQWLWLDEENCAYTNYFLYGLLILFFCVMISGLVEVLEPSFCCTLPS